MPPHRIPLRTRFTHGTNRRASGSTAVHTAIESRNAPQMPNTASPGAAATALPTALATTEGASLVGPLTLVAALALVGSGVAGLALLRRSLS
jgi:hypothetical protein